MRELHRIQVGENRYEFLKVWKGVELGKFSHPGQEKRRPMWPFRLRRCKWEFMKLPIIGQCLLLCIAGLWLSPG